MSFRRSLFGVVLAGLCAPAFAGAHIDLSSLDDATVSSSPRFIVKFRDGSAERTQAAARARALDLAAGRAQPQIHTTDAGGRNTTLHLESLRATARGGMHVIRGSHRLTRSEAEAVIRAIAADPDVDYVGVDALMHVAALPNDPLLATYQMWHYGTGTGGARVTTAWDEGAHGQGVVVAVIDTGATHHADLEPNLLPGYDFISDAFVSRRATDGRAPGGWDLGDWTAAGDCGPGSSARDSSWHGTHVSGTIAEVTDNGLGGAGVAPLAKIVPVRVLGRCGGYSSDIADAIVWAAGGTVPGIPNNPNPAEVISMSLGGDGACEQITQDAINAAVALGTTVVVAAGNENDDTMHYNPSSCANVIDVAAIGYSGRRASYSNYGTKVDIAAPGGGGTEGVPNGYVWSTINAGATSPAGDTYGGYTGTSMATPHVSGIVALIQSVAPKPLTPAQVKGLLTTSARPFPVTPDRPIGSGIVDAGAAVERAKTFGQPISAVPLPNGVVQAMPALAAGRSILYSIDVPAGATKLEFISYGGTGTISVYANYEAEPFPTANIGSSVRPGTNQTLTRTAPAPGRYYFRVVGKTDASGVLIRAKTY
jgi:serine protease